MEQPEDDFVAKQIEAYNRLFASLGGLYQLESDEIGADIFEMDIEGTRLHAIASRRIKVIPKIAIGFVKSSLLGARVKKEGDVYYIAINIGTYKILDSIFKRLLSHPKVLVEIGDSSLEKEKKIFLDDDYRKNRHLGDAELLSLAPDHDELTPACPERLYTAKYLTRQAITQIILHEMAHILCGHRGLCSTHGWLDWNDLVVDEPPAKLDFLSPEHRQALELDADSYSINEFLTQLINSHFSDRPGIIMQTMQFPYFVQDFTLWLFSLYSLFRLNGNKDFFSSIPKVAAHPPAAIRSFWCWGTLNVILDNHPQLQDLFAPQQIRQLKSSTLELIAEVEIAFQLISKEPSSVTWFEGPLFSAKYGEGYRETLRKPMDELSPLLIEHAYADAVQWPSYLSKKIPDRLR